MYQRSPSYDASKFSWKGWNGVAEASDLQMYNAPMGMYLKSDKTGAIRYFHLDRALKDREGETYGWAYTSDHLSIMIFND